MGMNLLESFIASEQTKVGEGSAPAKKKEETADTNPKDVNTEKKDGGKKPAGKKTAAAGKKAKPEQKEETQNYTDAKRGRPRVEDPEDLTQISLRIPKSLYKRMRVYLATSDEKDSMTELVRELLESYLDKKG